MWLTYRKHRRRSRDRSRERSRRSHRSRSRDRGRRRSSRERSSRRSRDRDSRRSREQRDSKSSDRKSREGEPLPDEAEVAAGDNSQAEPTAPTTDLPTTNEEAKTNSQEVSMETSTNQEVGDGDKGKEEGEVVDSLLEKSSQPEDGTYTFVHLTDLKWS